MSQTHIYTHPGHLHVDVTVNFNQSVTHQLGLAPSLLLHQEADAF